MVSWKHLYIESPGDVSFVMKYKYIHSSRSAKNIQVYSNRLLKFAMLSEYKHFLCGEKGYIMMESKLLMPNFHM